ncbi:MAG: penicillin-binding protein 2 [Myxococcota bacterium]
MRSQLLSDSGEIGKKYNYARLFIIICFLILVGRLIQLQIVYGNEYRQLSKDNFLQKRTLDASRGIITGQKGVVLAKNRIAFSVYITPQFFDEKAFEFLTSLLELNQADVDYIKQKILLAEGRKREYSLLALRDIPKEWVMIIESNYDQLPGVNIISQEKRFYPRGLLASHVVGYVGEVNREDIEKYKEMDYRARDWKGKYGIEKKSEKHLRGKKGFVWRVLDANGQVKTTDSALRWLPQPWKKDPVSGHNIKLTLDTRMQRALERSFKNYESGAAVILNVNNGKILAYLSKPAFDPNEMSGKLSASRAHEIYSSPLNPMLDKVSQGTYFPGSTYKIIPAIAALEEKLIADEEYHLCKGWYEFGRNSSFRCSHAHGLMNIHSAVVSSCNVFFFMLSERVGMDRMSRYAHLMGFGTTTGLSLNGEKAGFIPTKQWYAQKFQEGFRIGHTLNSAIGQGNVKVSVLQLAMVYALLANKGHLYQPQIIQKITDGQGVVIKDFKPIVKRKINLKMQTYDFMIDSLRGVVNDPSGTAYKSSLHNLKIAGKTGTAQVRAMARDDEDPQVSRWRFQDHAWFASFAPYDKPEIAVVVLVEHGGFASKAAVPLAMKIYQTYFEMNNN